MGMGLPIFSERRSGSCVVSSCGSSNGVSIVSLLSDFVSDLTSGVSSSVEIESPSVRRVTGILSSVESESRGTFFSIDIVTDASEVDAEGGGVGGPPADSEAEFLAEAIRAV